MNRFFYFLLLTSLVIFLFVSPVCGAEKTAIFSDSLCPARMVDSRYIYSLKVKDNKLYGIVFEQGSKSIVIFSPNGNLIDSIMFGGLLQRPDSAYLTSNIHDMAFDKKGNIWLTTYGPPIIISKKKHMKVAERFSQYEASGKIFIGKNNDIIISNYLGIFRTTNNGNSWEQLKGVFPETKRPAHISVYGDTIWYDLNEAKVNAVFQDRNGRYWAGSELGLICSDDNLETWHVYDSTAYAEGKYNTAVNSLIGITPNDDLIIWAHHNRLWIKPSQKVPRLSGELISEYTTDMQNNLFARINFPMLSGNYIIYIDRFYHQRSEGCFPPQDWLESCINISDDLGNSWKEYRIGKDIEISKVAVLGESVFVSSTKGLLLIPLKCFK